MFTFSQELPYDALARRRLPEGRKCQKRRKSQKRRKRQKRRTHFAETSRLPSAQNEGKGKT